MATGLLAVTAGALARLAPTAFSACAAKCDGLTYFTDSTGQGNGENFKIITANPTACKRIWWVNGTRQQFATETLTGYQYKRSLTSICEVVCYANGGVWGKLTCSEFTETGDPIDLACWKRCQNNNPNP
jgi:hypothetical protein